MAARGGLPGRRGRRGRGRRSAFADGLGQAGVAATGKHFPGFGAAAANTDQAAVATHRSRRCGGWTSARTGPCRPRVRLVMVSTAVYPALDRRPAALSRRVVTGELRGELGFEGVVVTDALDTPALSPVGGHGQVAIRSARAGADLLILAGTYAAGERAAAGLATAFRAGALPRAPAEEAVERLLRLRAELAARSGGSARPPAASRRVRPGSPAPS